MAENNKEAQEAVQRLQVRRMQAFEQGFFDKLAQFGWVPESDDQAERWLKAASLVEQRKVAATQDGDPHILDQLAFHLAKESGEAPELQAAEQELYREAVDKTASFIEDGDIAADILNGLYHEG